MTGTSSDFGKELDSLADVITFGVAPALFAWMWGFRELPTNLGDLYNKLLQFGAIASFLFLMAGASRLARFNITSNPQPSNPGPSREKVFCRHADSGRRGCHRRRGAFLRGRSHHFMVDRDTWMPMVVAVGYLMVSTWRFYSFKDIDFRSRQPFQLVILLDCFLPRFVSTPMGVVSDRAALSFFRSVLASEMDLPAERNPPPPPAYTEAPKPHELKFQIRSSIMH